MMAVLYFRVPAAMPVVMIRLWIHVKRGRTSKTDQGAVAGRNKTGKAVLFIAER
jgi:hypothetical protein